MIGIVRRRQRFLTVVAMGTLISILLQTFLCYQSVLADTVENAQATANEAILDEATADSATGYDEPGYLLASAQGPTEDTKKLLASVTADSQDSVESVTKQIMGKIFELERLNTYFRIESTKVSKWRRWRQFIGDESAAAIVGAGVLLFIIYSIRSLHRGYTNTFIKFHGLDIPGKFFKLPPNTALEDGLIITIPGIWVSVLQETFELGQNYYNDWKAKQHGFDPKTTRTKATDLQNRIDSLMAERAKLIDSQTSSPEETKLLNAETKVLKDMRDLSLLEYRRYYASAKGTRTYQNTFYMVDIAEKVTGFVSLLMGLIGLHLNRRNYFVDLGYMQIISAILLPMAPIVAKIHSSLRAKAAMRSVSQDIKGIDVQSPDVFDADRKNLEDMVLGKAGNTPLLSSLSARDSIYKMESDNLYALQALSKREAKFESSDFKQTLAIRAFGIGNKTAFGTIAIVGGVVHLNNPRHFMDLLLAATTPYEVTLDAAFGDNLRRMVSGEIRLHKDRLAGITPGQIYSKRLDRLEKMESLAKAN